MDRKTVVAFACGAALASGVAYVAVIPWRTPDPARSATSIPAAVAPALPPNPAPTAAGEPVRVPGARQAAAALLGSAHPVKPKLRKPSPMPIGEEVASNLPQPEPAASSPVAPEPVAPDPPAPQPEAPEPAPPPQSVETASITPAAAPAPVPATPQPLSVTLTPGMILTGRVGETISTARNQPGDLFLVTLDQPLVVDGYVIAERGARAQGRVVEVRRADGFKGRSLLTVELAKFSTSDGQTIPVHTAAVREQAQNPPAANAAKVGIGAVIGAAIGGIAGGGKGAGIGAGVGGAAGAGDVLLTHGKDAVIPVETRLIFRIEQPVTITERLR